MRQQQAEAAADGATGAGASAGGVHQQRRHGGGAGGRRRSLCQEGAGQGRTLGEAVPQLLAEVDAQERLRGLVSALAARGGADLGELRAMEEEPGPAARFPPCRRHRSAPVRPARRLRRAGARAPRGVPILVARRSQFDALLRRVGRGTDLWFQVREGAARARCCARRWSAA